VKHQRAQDILACRQKPKPDIGGLATAKENAESVFTGSRSFRRRPVQFKADLTTPGQIGGEGSISTTDLKDTLFDLAKALFCSAHEDARSHQPLLEGYGPIDHPEPERVLLLYTLFHRVSMWCWLTKLGHKASADDGPGGLLHDLDQMAR
jgi:hypothetical protein